MNFFDFLRSQPGEFFALPRKSNGKWTVNILDRHELDEKYLQRHAGDDLYFCPNGFNAKSSLKRHVVPGHWLYADLDEAHPHLIRPRPTVAWRTSTNRHQCMWRVDQFNEDVNRRLSQAVGARIEGWPSNASLRIWGSTNFKYALRARVELMWANGPRYTIAQISQYLPSENSAQVARRDAGPTFDGSRLSPGVQRWLKQKQTTKASDPTVLARIMGELVNAGADEDKAVAMVIDTPWNRWARRSTGGDAELRKEYRKAADKANKAD